MSDSIQDIADAIGDLIQRLGYAGTYPGTYAELLREAIAQLEHANAEARLQMRHVETVLQEKALLAAENAQIRALMDSYNLGGWTDSLALMKERDQLAAQLKAREEQEPVAVVQNCSTSGQRVHIMSASLTAGDYLYVQPKAEDA